MMRYQRQIILPEIGAQGQKKLKAARVLVVGAGGLGCPVLSYLTAAGVGIIKIADGDVVDCTNLHRQVLFGDGNIGKNKAIEASNILKQQNPTIDVIPISENINYDNVKQILAEVDLVIDGSDNFYTKYLLSDASIELNKILVSGSIFCYEGQLSVFNYKDGPSYRCLYPNPPFVELIPSCAEAGVLGVLPGLIGTLQATEALKIILGIGDVLSGRLLIYDALSSDFTKIRFDKTKNATIKIQDKNYYDSLKKSCGINKISPHVLKQKILGGQEIVLIDVREPSEKSAYDIGGRSIPLKKIKDNLDLIPRDKEVIVYCEGGVRSKQAIDKLNKEFGYTNLTNLEGGMLAWRLSNN